MLPSVGIQRDPRTSKVASELKDRCELGTRQCARREAERCDALEHAEGQMWTEAADPHPECLCRRLNVERRTSSALWRACLAVSCNPTPELHHSVQPPLLPAQEK